MTRAARAASGLGDLAESEAECFGIFGGRLSQPWQRPAADANPAPRGPFALRDTSSGPSHPLAGHWQGPGTEPGGPPPPAPAAAAGAPVRHCIVTVTVNPDRDTEYLP
jgi:hypothetical protein